MMDHLSDKPRDFNWKVVQNNVVKYLLENRGLATKYTPEEVNHVVGALEVNAFEVQPEGGGKGRGIFPLTALMSHSCVANTRYVSFRLGNRSSRSLTALALIVHFFNANAVRT